MTAWGEGIETTLGGDVPLVGPFFAHCHLFHGPKPYKFIGFGDVHGPKPYKFIGSGDVHGPKPYEFIGFGARPSKTLPGRPGKPLKGPHELRVHMR